MSLDKNVINTRTHKHTRSRRSILSRFAKVCFVVFVPLHKVEIPFRRRHLYTVAAEERSRLRRYAKCQSYDRKSHIVSARKAQLLLRRLGIRIRD
jgi:hypothetical protein